METPATPSPACLTGAKPRILVVDHEPDMRSFLRTLLEEADYDVITAANAPETLTVSATAPDIAAALVDLQLPNMNGLRVARRLRKDHGIAVILMTREPHTLVGADVARSDAYDFILKPPNAAELLLRSKRAVEARKIRAVQDRRVRDLRLLSITDSLTGLFNARHFHQLLKSETARASRYGRDVSVLLLDLESFKTFNDTHGHPEGDRALRRVGKVLRAGLRETDHACRCGGDEFTVILPETGPDAAMAVARRLGDDIAATTFRTRAGARAPLAVSIGMAHWQVGEPLTALLKRADQALYESKRRGRNRVTASPHARTVKSTGSLP